MPIGEPIFAGSTPRVVAIVPSYIASCQINVLKPLTALGRSGRIRFKHCLESKASRALISWADIVVFCRNTEPGFNHLLIECIGKKKPVIYDIDDSFWDITPDTDPELARYHLQPLRLRQLEQYISLATLVRVYSPLLLAKVAQFNPVTRIYRSAFDFSLLPSTSLKENKESKQQAEHQSVSREKLGIVYATSRTVDDQFKIFLPALQQFMARHQNQVEMTVWGCAPPELLNLPGVKAKKLVQGYDEFLREFSRSRFTVGLAPLSDNDFNRAKNNTKFRDYGACRIAGIYSDLDVYSHSVRSGENGLLVKNNTDAWQDALKLLVFDPALRERIRQNAFQDVYRDYRQELIEEQWMTDIDELVSSAPSCWSAGQETSSVLNFSVTASRDNWSGIELDSSIIDFNSSDTQKVHLEVSVNGISLRSVASVIPQDSGSKLTLMFRQVRNSRGQSFDVRLRGHHRIEVPRGGKPDSFATLLYESN